MFKKLREGDSRSWIIIIWLFIFLYLPFLNTYGYQIRNENFFDFPTFYWAAKLAFNENVSPYTANAFSEATLLLNKRVYSYLYPPTSLLVFYPFSLVSFRVAKSIMLGINHACVLLFIYLFYGKILTINLRPPYAQLFAALSLVYMFTYYGFEATFVHNQINLVVLIFICLTWYAFKQDKRSLLIALPLSIAIVMKTYPVLLTPLLITNKKYGAMAWVLVLLFIYAAVAYVVLPESVWLDWYTNVLPTGGYGKIPFNLWSPAAPDNQSINGFISRTFIPNEFGAVVLPNAILGRALAYMFSVLLILISISLSFLSSRKGNAEKTIDLQFSMFLLMMFLVAPLSWESQQLFILPSAIIAIYILIATKQKYTWQVIVGLSICTVAWRVPHIFWFVQGLSTRGLSRLAVSLKFYAIVSLWVFFAHTIYNNPRNRMNAPSLPEEHPAA